MQGVIRTYDPTAARAWCVRDTDRAEIVLASDALEGRSSGCCARASGSCSSSTPTTARSGVRIGSEVDMGLPPDVQV